MCHQVFLFCDFLSPEARNGTNRKGGAMNRHITPVATAFVIGFLGLAVAFAFASISGRGEIGIAAAAVFFVFGSAFLVRKHPASTWYGGVVINMPLWIFFKFIAEAGQFETFFWGLFVLLLTAYAGTAVGLWLTRNNVKTSAMTKTFLIILPLALIILGAYILNAPKPIPADKMMFVGTWKTASGFTLQISGDGTAMIAQHLSDNGSDYEQLAIKVAPPRIASANVEFSGATSLTVVRHGYYARQYRIDQAPHQDDGTYRMVLNGVVLVKE
jgi:hypothetical protein